MNRIGSEMDAIAASLHPSAWPEALAAKRDRWHALAHPGTPTVEIRMRPAAPSHLPVLWCECSHDDREHLADGSCGFPGCPCIFFWAVAPKRSGT